MARVTAFQAVGRGFESRLPLITADVAQLVEHVLGKDEVTGSIPVISSIIIFNDNILFFWFLQEKCYNRSNMIVLKLEF